MARKRMGSFSLLLKGGMEEEGRERLLLTKYSILERNKAQ